MTASMISRIRVLLAALCLLAAQGLMAKEPASPFFAGKRLALVIGNGKYPTAALKNPANDARAMARTLKELGFEVTLRENTTQRDLAAAIRQFGSSITPGSAALFYFAGHGMQVKGRNYLVPVDADIQLEDEVPYSTIDVSLVLDKMEVGKSAINLVILDACRNNPFARRFRSSSTGLAQMDAPIGTLIAFATAPGSVAQDGAGENGIYTKHLLENIALPGLPVEQMFKRVRVGVAKETSEAQIPWESSSMKGDFAFKEAQASASQDKLIEEAVRAAAERAAALTAERMAREQTAMQPQNDRAKAEQEALAAEREKLQRERERLAAERAKAEQEALAAERERLQRERERLAAEKAALHSKAAQSPGTVALAAPMPAPHQPAAASPPTGRNRPQVGDSWTYRFSDGYGKTLDYTVRVTGVSDAAIADELSHGKARHAGQFEQGLELASRIVSGVSIREISPYLQNFGKIAETNEWSNISIPGGLGPFRARLAGKETVKVPAGSFDAAKIVIEGEEIARGTMTRRLIITAWYAPEARRFVKASFQSPNLMGGLAGDRDSIELLSTSFAVSTAADPAAARSGAVPAEYPVGRAPAGSEGAPGLLPKIGDTWTYRFSDVYGKSETYTVRVTAVSAGEIADEARLGKARHSGSFAPGLELADRRLGTLALREISPYLLSLGPLQEQADWKALKIFEGSPPFSARLAGSETVQVPAGAFEARKIVLEGQQYRQRNNPSWGSLPFTLTAWYAPKAKRLVKLKIDGPFDKETIELVDIRLQ